MLSIDTNILFHAFNKESPYHHAAYTWIFSLRPDENVAISELILAEFHGLLRNPTVLHHPLSSKEATEVIQTYRCHPYWRLIGFPHESRSLHDQLWKLASVKSFAFRRLYDVRSALTMIAQGVTDFATTNVKDYQNLGFHRVWNPLTKSTCS